MDKEKPTEIEMLPAPLPEEKSVSHSLNEKEKDTIEQWTEQYRKSRSPSEFVVIKDKDGNPRLSTEVHSKRGNEIEKKRLFHAGLCLSAGVKDSSLGIHFIIDCIRASGFGSTKDDLEKLANNCNMVLNALHALRPQDEFEGMLISRLVALHFQIMNFMERTIREDQSTPIIDLNVNRVAKLSRLYNESLETLMRYRRKGEQKVVVQHVNIEGGAQAIVNNGNMVAGGMKEKIDEVTPC